MAVLRTSARGTGPSASTARERWASGMMGCMSRTPGTTAQKHEALRRLARQRRESRWAGYRQPEDYGYNFFDLVSPYTRAAGNVDADVMLLLQDWASHDVLSGPFDPERARFGHDPGRITNKRLKDLLHRHLRLRLEDTYGTNLFPFIKVGGMSAHIPASDLAKAAREFARPQVEIVGPRIVVALGSGTSRALSSVGVAHFALPHPAARISSLDMESAWQRLAEKIPRAGS